MHNISLLLKMSLTIAHLAKKIIQQHCVTDLGNSINPLTPGTFCQNWFFFDILVVLKLDRGQIYGFSLLENSLVARQLAVLATRIAFKIFWPRHAQKSKFWTRK